MKPILSYPIGLSKFNPLDTILCYDDFDNGRQGWLDLKPNYRFADFLKVGLVLQVLLLVATLLVVPLLF